MAQRVSPTRQAGRRDLFVDEERKNAEDGVVGGDGEDHITKRNGKRENAAAHDDHGDVMLMMVMLKVLVLVMVMVIVMVIMMIIIMIMLIRSMSKMIAMLILNEVDQISPWVWQFFACSWPLCFWDGFFGAHMSLSQQSRSASSTTCSHESDPKDASYAIKMKRRFFLTKLWNGSFARKSNRVVWARFSFVRQPSLLPLSRAWLWGKKWKNAKSTARNQQTPSHQLHL